MSPARSHRPSWLANFHAGHNPLHDTVAATTEPYPGDVIGE
ncbi:hypothetical protein FRUB_00144 [Fimbriiglobus ruber]|uniref:Uncharacterized protein n=1 Tax=Fimbriiglobus ruber TaxID=1908690 RepID=A0A225EDD5_9BACT|nr:hypothetical protein FRUB_00144 [Fimbriiglobus ruber]